MPAHLALALISVESGWKPRAVSPKGAIGLTQVMPATAKGMNVTCDLFEPPCNLHTGLTYLRRMLDQFKDPRLALAAYIGGPGVFSKRYSEATRQEIESYVRNVIVTANQLAPARQ
ncbi:MAG: lytic transglycosylase domain-containing protein [Acidobacteria bacterium]|nr:lytic transglycosylase domain-containing protein [Acidobacteriota bacterium]